MTTTVFNFLLLGLAGNVAVAAYGVVANFALVATAIFNGVAQGAHHHGCFGSSRFAFHARILQLPADAFKLTAFCLHFFLQGIKMAFALSIFFFYFCKLRAQFLQFAARCQIFFRSCCAVIQKHFQISAHALLFSFGTLKPEVISARLTAYFLQFSFKAFSLML